MLIIRYGSTREQIYIVYTVYSDFLCNSFDIQSPSIFQLLRKTKQIDFLTRNMLLKSKRIQLNSLRSGEIKHRHCFVGDFVTFK